MAEKKQLLLPTAVEKCDAELQLQSPWEVMEGSSKAAQPVRGVAGLSAGATGAFALHYFPTRLCSGFQDISVLPVGLGNPSLRKLGGVYGDLPQTPILPGPPRL